MIITTKYDIDEDVYFINMSKINKAKVYSILIDPIKDNNFEIHYEIINENKEYYKNILNGKAFKEKWLFSSKEELISSL